MEAEKRRPVGIDLGKREYTTAIIGKNGKMKIHHKEDQYSGSAGAVPAVNIKRQSSV